MAAKVKYTLLTLVHSISIPETAARIKNLPQKSFYGRALSPGKEISS
jgi:hypothetical protein